MLINKIVKLYKKNAVSVCGLVGSGKDMLTANVIERRKLPHISNCKYNEQTMPLDFKALDISGNTYRNFIENNLIKYDYPYFDGLDVYISDCGIYFPSQYCGELNRDYKHIPTFMALSRQLGGGTHVHYNSQNLNRVWDKIREHADVYIRAHWTKVLFNKIVIQKITIYDKYQSCLDNIKPCRISVPLLASPQTINQAKMHIDSYTNSHGSVKNHYLVYVNKSKYDTRIFKEMLKNGRNQPKF